MTPLLGLIGAAAALAPVESAGCEALALEAIANVTIIEARAVPAGPFNANPFAAAAPSIELPAYCRVRAVTTPSPGSRIGFEVWMPAERWNGRLRMFGNGGYGSTLPTGNMAAALARGDAVTATDTGHDGEDPEFAVGRPQTIDDWGRRAVHETIVAAKTFVTRHYGNPAKHAYFEGCSTGGHQGMMEAQRYPSDFDGIVAGAPGSNRTRLNIGFLWQFVHNHDPAAPGKPILPPAKLRVLGAASFAACKGSNGGRAGGLATDPWLNDPMSCRFDPAVLSCEADDQADCLTEPQVRAARAIYSGARNPRSGEQIYPPWLPGSESAGPAASPLPGWSLYWADPRQPAQPARASFFRHWVPFGPTWDPHSFDFDADVSRVDQALAARVNATDPDLRAFQARGGKLIVYHGLADPVVSPLDTIAYYRSVSARKGDAVDSFYRLFLAPGVEHCRGGPGFDDIDTTSAIEAWVEGGKAPAFLAAGRASSPGQTRPLCPYPQRAHLRSGRFVCAGK